MSQCSLFHHNAPLSLNSIPLSYSLSQQFSITQQCSRHSGTLFRKNIPYHLTLVHSPISSNGIYCPFTKSLLNNNDSLSQHNDLLFLQDVQCPTVMVRCHITIFHYSITVVQYNFTMIHYLIKIVHSPIRIIYFPIQ